MVTVACCRSIWIQKSERYRELSSTNIAPSPSSSPTLVVEQTLPPLLPQNQNVEGSTASGTDAAPAIMVGLASCIIVFAVLFYLNDVRDRLQENSDENDNKSDSKIVEGATTSVPAIHCQWRVGIGSPSSAPNLYPLLSLQPKISRSLSAGRCLYLSRLSNHDCESMMESSWSFECR